MNTARLTIVAAAFAAHALLAGCAAVVVGAAAGGAAIAVDRRQPDVIATDERIELTASSRIGDALKDKGHVNVTSFNRQVLLTGESTTPELKAEAERIAAAVPDVRGVVNEIVATAPTALTNRSNDAYLTSQVKARFVGFGKFNPLQVKVVTEAQVVYLMGLVTQQEAADATEIARTTSGVRKVVRVFEYIPDPKPAPVPAPGQK